MHRNLEGQDEKFVRDFFAWHPTKSERLADAVVIHVVSGVCANDRRFEFYLADGTAMDASHQKPLKALTSLDHHRHSVLGALCAISLIGKRGSGPSMSIVMRRTWESTTCTTKHHLGSW